MNGVFMEKLLVLIGENVRKYRIERGLLPDELAEMAGLSLDEVRMLEQGKGNIEMIVISKVSKALDVSISHLVSIKN